MPDPIRILICPLSTHERSGWWSPELGMFIADLCHQNGFAAGVMPLHAFIPAAGARNLVSKRVAEGEDVGRWDWLCMIDNDMVPPANLLDIVKDAPPEAGIVVPEFAYFNQATKKLAICWSWNGPTEKVAVERGWHELTKCGTGAIFIRPSAFKGVPYPYFEYVYNEDGVQTGTEDIRFCEKARAVGVRIFGNNKFIVGHYKSVNLSVMAEMLFEQKSLDALRSKSVDFVPSTERPSVAEAR